ncbi:MAG: clostripain-related cysteine peptidase [Candidatus Azobacteroides sp.]|nr:clostripain-related cysteine peptidase [Candidatus Azobacteroides sp.]
MKKKTLKKITDKINNRRAIQYFFRIAACLALFFSCKEEEKIPPVVPELPERTIIAYLAGDNDLSSEISPKIDALQQGMEQMGETDNHLIVYADYHDQMPELLEVTASGTKQLEQYAARNSASAANFSAVLQQVMQDFPAKSYGLICFSHASGWLPQNALNNPDGFVKNASSAFRSVLEDSGYEMPLAEFADAIPLAPNGDKLKFILLETCYMAGVEVAYELRNKTEWILASAAEMLSPGWEDIYPSQLAGLFMPEPQLKDFAQAYFDYRNNQTGASRSATVSLIGTDKMEELANEVKALCSTENNTVDVSNIQCFNRNSYHLFFDLSDYVETLANPDQISDYEKTLSEVVIYQAATSQFMSGYPYSFLIRKHCGLTTYIEQPQYPDLNQAWQQLGWSQAILAK